MWNKIFFKYFQTLILEKKREKKEKEPNLLLITTLLLMSSITQIFSNFVKEISYIIIIRGNISSNGKNQYY